MSEPSGTPDGNTSPPRRRMSIADVFSSRPSRGPASTSPPSGVPANPDTPGHRRGVSISTLGLVGSAPNQTSPYDAFARQRRASIATSTTSSSPEFRNSFGDENAVIEEDEMASGSYAAPSSPSFARRMSFGAQALRDARQSGASNGGRRPSSSFFASAGDSRPSEQSSRRAAETAKARGEGFNWSEALRDRTRRSPSFSTGNPFASGTNRAKPPGQPAAAGEPPKEMPKATTTPSRMKKPDHLGERMLRGDFMMD